MIFPLTLWMLQASRVVRGTASTSGNMAVDSVSRGAIAVLGTVFAGLAVGLLIDPITLQEPHGLDFSRSPPSALAEIRAYYFGTMAVLAAYLLRGVVGSAADRIRALEMGGSVIGLFALARVYSYIVDGPPNNSHAEIMWAAEALGAVGAFGLWWAEKGRQTAWGRG